MIEPIDGRVGVERPVLSVVVPVLDGGARLIALAEAVARQQAEGGVELLLVDSGSTDGAFNVALRRGPNTRGFRHVATAFDHGLSRQRAASYARGPWIAFLSQDAVPVGRHFLASLRDAAERTGAWGVSARQVPRPGADPLVRSTLERWTPGPASGFSRPVAWAPRRTAGGPPLPCPGAGLCFDNVASLVDAARLRAHPFRPSAFGEDLRWAADVGAAGGTLAYDPRATVEHHHDPNVPEAFDRNRRAHLLLAEDFGVVAVPSLVALLAALPATLDSNRRTAGSRWALRAAPRSAAALVGQWAGARAARLRRGA